MEFKRKDLETMIFIDKFNIVVPFKDGIAKTSDEIGREMIKMGYVNIENSQPEDKGEKSMVVESKSQNKKQPQTKPLKPIKPLVEKQEDDSEINSEI